MKISIGGDEPLVRSRPRSILLADDEELVRVGTADMLIDLGHHVHQAASGTQALEILRREVDIEVIVTDYLMPGMTGADLIGQARLLRPRLLALLITGYANLGEDVGRGLHRLNKPFRLNDLAAAIAQLADDTVMKLPYRTLKAVE